MAIFQLTATSRPNFNSRFAIPSRTLASCGRSFFMEDSAVLRKALERPTKAKEGIETFMVDMALATSAAPTIYRPLESGGYRLIDGGAWANNPVMLAVVEAMITLIRSRGTSWASIGCGDEPYHVTRRMTWAMRAQSLAATNQARLLLGPASIVRIEPTPARPHGRRESFSGNSMSAYRILGPGC